MLKTHRKDVDGQPHAKVAGRATGYTPGRQETEESRQGEESAHAWMLGSACCAAYDAKLNTGCARREWRITFSPAGGRGGLSVTKVSGA